VSVMEMHVKDLEAVVAAAASDLAKAHDTAAAAGGDGGGEGGTGAGAGASAASDVGALEGVLQGKQKSLELARGDLAAVQAKLKTLGT
jgi:hypothetical protein